MREIRILDGPLGTELEARGVATPLPVWSAAALESAPEVVAEIHSDYAAAGATIHTTNTFRTRPDVLGDDWKRWARRAVELVRESVPAGHLVAGSIAPLADCYSPELSPADRDPVGTRERHAELARLLAAAGCDVILCETFPHVGESLLALEAAVASGVEAWVGWTPGPEGDLLTPDQLDEAAERALDRGARGLFVNCVATELAAPYVEVLGRRAAGRGLTVGVYANAGCPDSASGWESHAVDIDGYLASARRWIELGANVVGGCCGTSPRLVRALARTFQ